jgi:hypothetical protein
VYNKPRTQFQLRISVTGLRPTPAGDAYAVWLRPEVGLTSGGYQLVPCAKPILLGVIRPPVGTDGKLKAVAVTSRGFTNGAHRMLLTLQSARELKAPHRVVVQGDGVALRADPYRSASGDTTR